MVFMEKNENYKRLFEEFNHLSVMIIGDVMLDTYLWGKVERISPEAPIPIVALRKREHRMGGAANVARNIQSLGARAILCSVIGADDKGSEFLALLKKEKIESTGIIKSKRRITTTKFRIFGNSNQMLRVDEEIENDLDETDYLTLIRVIDHILTNEKIDCIIFQDYDKGVITPKLISEVVQMAQKRKIPVTVDPKKKNFKEYQKVTLFKPNLKEMKEGLGFEGELNNNEAITEAVHQLRAQLNCHYVLTTLSENGVMISYKDKHELKSIFVPAHQRIISDVSGAGDTVISVASLCLALMRTPYEIAFISNLAGGLVCEEVGVSPVNKEKLLKEVQALL